MSSKLTLHSLPWSSISCLLVTTSFILPKFCDEVVIVIVVDLVDAVSVLVVVAVVVLTGVFVVWGVVDVVETTKENHHHNLHLIFPKQLIENIESETTWLITRFLSQILSWFSSQFLS